MRVSLRNPSTAISASVTGLPSALRQTLKEPAKYFRAIWPASRTEATRSSVSASGTGNRHAVDTQGRRIRAVAEHEIVGGREFAVHVLEIARDSDLAHRICKFAVLDPETGRAARIIAGDAVHPHTDQLGHIDAL